MTVLNFSVVAASRIDFYTFFLGKVLRMALFIFFTLGMFARNNGVAGYSVAELLLFVAVMNLLDITLQLVFRAFGDHSRVIRNGDFDCILVKPISSLFWSSMRIFDLFDLTTVPVAIGIFWYALRALPMHIGVEHWILGIGLFACSLLIGFALQTAIATLYFWTVDVSNAQWLFREFLYSSRFPAETFPRTIQTVFTSIIPVFVMTSFPTKALLGTIRPTTAALTLLLAPVAVYASIRFWKFGLRSYTSASS